MKPGNATLVPPFAEGVVIDPVDVFGGTVRLPGSKSFTNRALLVAALASGRSVLRNALECDDSRYMIEALRKLGVQITVAPDFSTITVNSLGGAFPVKRGEFFLGNAGTATRFLTAALATAGGTYLVDGDTRMRERPIADLVDALNTLGADVRAPTGCPPVHIGPRALSGGEIDMPGSVSSQFISAILMTGPLGRRRLAVRIKGELVSRPYIDMTLEVMGAFGARAYADDKRADGQPLFVVVPGRGYDSREYSIEGDASAASYFYAAAAVTGGTVRVEGVGKESNQGDLRCADVLAEMGCRVLKERDAVTVTGGLLRGVDCDCGDMPDVVPTLGVAALFARGRTRLRGVPHLRYKESDRIASVASGLRSLGGEVKELKDGLEIKGAAGAAESPLHGAEIRPWGDHRLAMAFAITALRVPQVVILDPQVVSKSFPGFFHALSSLGAQARFRLPGGRDVPCGDE